MQLARVLVGDQIKIDVSVLLGSATPPGVAVTTVTISRGSHVVVDALAKFGVRPTTLSMTDVGTPMPFLPTVLSVSPRIEIANVEPPDRIESLADAEADQLAPAKSAMRSTKAVAGADIVRFERQRTTSVLDVRQWLTALLARYETWLARLSPPSLHGRAASAHNARC